VQIVGVVHVGEVVENVEGKINVYLVKGTSILTKLTNFLLFRGCLLCFLEGRVKVFYHLASSTFFKETMDFFFELFEVFFFCFYFFFFNWLL